MLETERLILRRLDEGDLDDVFAMRGDAEIMRFIRAPQGREESLDWIKLVSSRWEGERLGFCGVILKETQEFVGWCGLWRLKETGEVEVGYAITKEFWGRGLASEAAEAFLEFGFTELDLERIVAVAFPENWGSRRVMEKLGMSFDYLGEFYGHELVHYSISREEFFARRGDLTPTLTDRGH